MEMERTANAELPSPRMWLTSHAIPGALGVCAAFALGAAGFSLGCLYAQLVAPEPTAIRVAGPGAAPARPQRAAATITDGVGGPEEQESLAAQPAVAQPVLLEPPATTPAVAAPIPGGFALSIAMARPVAGGWVSSRYGQRTDPFTGQPAVHRGLDYAGLNNSPILAAAAGVVTRAGRQGGYGNFIEIDHGRGWVTRYGHNAFNLVAPGAYVKPGQPIALMGSTGRATGTHLHFEVLYRGRHQNPARLVRRSA